MYKHLMIISDGECQENSLHLTDRARAERLIEALKGGVLSEEVQEAMQEMDEDAGSADYPEGISPRPMNPEDYIDTLRDLLNGHDFDLYLDDVDRPEALSATPIKAVSTA